MTDSPTAAARKPSRSSAEVLLSFATVPLLIGLVAGKAIADAVQEIGLLSEEVFRGDRLPTLNVPVNAASDQEDVDR
ncbi:hypothetical protein H6F43_18760 [Leptolyngbya sp. FACHB-36]|uniref:hypothetical protein n=1 Tax=Leptolyngbya sp. FACHB-36 TaxID=2692808 RepID=UPI00167FFD38|nr:hypothetical protein [Leptolyngbya sp. FACHB-36]MBD2022225.1 hypothetical protein [Leptolyngbya sp. FACHB-36]